MEVRKRLEKSIHKTEEARQHLIKMGQTNIQETEKSIFQFKKMLDLLQQKNPKKQEVHGLLCYKSLAYCCSLTKPCIYRDTALAVFGISEKQFQLIKNETHQQFMEARRGNDGQI